LPILLYEFFINAHAYQYISMWAPTSDLLVDSARTLILDDVGRGDPKTEPSPRPTGETAWCGSLLYEERPMKRIKKFFKSDLGATAIEYGLIAALISVVIIAALQLTGNSLKTVFNNVASALTTATN
jgi:pilus assembly protein Flp/PilA